jgi:hypothetical protein
MLSNVNPGGYPDPHAFVFLGNDDGSFQPPQQTQDGFLTFATGDFNGDGVLDLAGFNGCSPAACTFGILLGNGDGTFSRYFSAFEILPANQNVMQVVTGDFNGDGKLDVAMEDSGNVYVFLGNGDGTLQNALISNVGGLDLVAGVGDFNGDGKLDLIGVEGTQLAWLQGNGDGTFQTPSTLYTLGGDTVRIIAADLNGDGKLDLITVQNSGTFTVLLGNGDGTFQTGVAYPYPGGGGGVIGDFNADGKLDLVLSDASTPSTLLYLGNGDGTFQNAFALPSGPFVFDGVAGDFNNDGKLDLVLVSNMAGPLYLLQETPQPSFSPTSATFASQVVGTSSSPQSVTLTNTNNGTGPLLISSIAIAGANSGDFSQTNNCPASLAVGANCQISITFTPIATGVRDASLAVTDNAPGSPQSIPLSGTGTQPLVQFYPSIFNPSTETVGGTSSPQLLLLSNKGSSTLTISSIGVIGANAGDFADTNTCGSTLGVGASCKIEVTFTPTASGARSADLTVSDNAPGSPQTVALSGTGQDFSLAPKGSATATVAPGQTATYTVDVTPGGGFNQTVNLSCTGAQAQSTCTVSSSVTLDGVNSSMATVSVVTNASAMGLTQPVNAPPTSGTFSLWLQASGILGLCVLATLRGRGRVRNPQLVCGVTLVCLLSIGTTMSACGGSSNSSGGSGGTQAGTYTLTVTGSSGAAKLTNKTNLSLVVQ